MKSNYICNCIHYDFFNKNYIYWENRDVTTEEKTIVNYIQSQNYKKKLKILHVGIGNSYLYEKLNSYHSIIGITLSNSEINKSKLYNDDNYKVYYCDKMSINLNKIFNNIKFDLIIDTNLKSYSCCQTSFEFMFENYVNLLSSRGMIISNTNGMKWVKRLKPKLSFSFKNLFHYKMKEIDGDSDNIFSINEANQLCHRFSLKLITKDNVIIFDKLS